MKSCGLKWEEQREIAHLCTNTNDRKQMDLQMNPFAAMIALVVAVWQPITARAQQPDALYLTQIAAAEAYLQMNETVGARRFLESCAPESRGLEWALLNAWLNQAAGSLEAHRGAAANSVAISPDGRLLATAGADSLIRVYRLPDLSLQQSLSGHTASVSTLSFSPDGQLLASGGRDRVVKIWNIENGRELRTISEGLSQGIYQVRFSPDGKNIALVSWELTGASPPVLGFARIYELGQGLELAKYPLDSHPAADIAFSPSGEQMYISTWGEIAYCFNLGNPDPSWKFDLSEPEEYNAFRAMAISPDGSRIALGSADKRIYMLDAATGAELYRIESWEGHQKSVEAICFSPDGRQFATAGEDMRILIRDTETGKWAGELHGHNGKVTELAWGSSTPTLYSTSSDGSLKWWDMDRPFRISFDVCRNGPWGAPLSPDEETFAAPCSDLGIGTWELNTGRRLALLEGQKGNYGAFTPDGRFLATVGHDGIVRWWNIASQKELFAMEAHVGSIGDIVALKTQPLIATVADYTLRLWHTEEKGACFKTIPLQGGQPSRLALSPDEQLLYVAFSNGQIQALSTSDWTPAFSLTGAGGLLALKASPDGQWLATSHSNGDVFTWNLASRQPGHHFKGHLQSTYAISFSPDSRYLASGSYDQALRLWKLDSGQNTLTLHGFRNHLFNVAFLRDGKGLLVTETNGAVHRFRWKE